MLTKKFQKFYPVPKINTKSTIGAGDTFNAGVISGLSQLGITKSSLNDLRINQWEDIINRAILFATNVCVSFDNYISNDLAQEYRTIN